MPYNRSHRPSRTFRQSAVRCCPLQCPLHCSSSRPTTQIRAIKYTPQARRDAKRPWRSADTSAIIRTIVRENTRRASATDDHEDAGAPWRAPVLPSCGADRGRGVPHRATARRLAPRRAGPHNFLLNPFSRTCLVPLQVPRLPALFFQCFFTTLLPRRSRLQLTPCCEWL